MDNKSCWQLDQDMRNADNRALMQTIERLRLEMHQRFDEVLVKLETVLSEIEERCPKRKPPGLYDA